MSWSLSKIVGLVLVPLLIGSTIMGGYQAIRTGPLNNQSSKVDTLLDKEARHISFGDGVKEEVAERQFTDALILNQVSAINCRLLFYLAAESKNGERLANYVSESKISSEISGSSTYVIKYSIAGRAINPEKRLFNYLNDTEYVPSCVGTKNTVPKIISDNVVQETTSGKVLNPLTAVKMEGQEIHEISSNIWASLTCDKAPKWARQRGYDMEGKFGKISFSSEKTFFVKENPGQNNRVWKIQTLLDTCPGSDNFRGPDFWAAGEWMNLFPYPEESSPQELGWFNGGAPFDGTKNSNLVSDALIDAPTVTDVNLPEEGGTNSDNYPWHDVSYVICKGAEGYMQTNAFSPGNEGEATYGAEAHYRGKSTRTYTFIRMERNGKACIDDEDIASGKSLKKTGGLAGKTCNFEQATRDKDVTAYNSQGEERVCKLVPYKWRNSNGKLIDTIYQVGWVKS
ncbi:MAG: hypothetical protein ABEJ93_01745 [Candidatus Nanohalobium sp.]